MTIKEGGRSLRFVCTGAVSYLENKAVRRRARAVIVWYKRISPYHGNQTSEK